VSVVIRSVALALTFALGLTACDSGTSDDGWAGPGARLTFAYVSGPDPILAFGSAEAFQATPGAAVLQVERNGATADGDLFVTWAFPHAPASLPYAEAYPVRSAFRLPLLDTAADVAPYSVSVYASADCNPYDGSSGAATREVRVPPPGTPVGSPVLLRACDGEVGTTFIVREPQRVTVPAGTFDALVLAGERNAAGDRTVEFWAGPDGLVRVDLENEAGVLRGSLVLASR
jgi:hypothetical protein